MMKLAQTLMLQEEEDLDMVMMMMTKMACQEAKEFNVLNNKLMIKASLVMLIVKLAAKEKKNLLHIKKMKFVMTQFIV